MAENPCEHQHYFVNIDVARLTDTAPVRFFAHVEINCADCAEPFHFIGVERHGYSPDAPAISHLGTRIALPILPGREKETYERTDL